MNIILHITAYTLMCTVYDTMLCTVHNHLNYLALYNTNTILQLVIYIHTYMYTYYNIHMFTSIWKYNGIPRCVMNKQFNKQKECTRQNADICTVHSRHIILHILYHEWIIHSNTTNIK